MYTKNIDSFLKSLGIEQKELAKKLNINPNTIGNWKRTGKIPEKYYPQLEKLLSERQPNNYATVVNSGVQLRENNESNGADAENAKPLALAEFKPVIPSKLYNRLDCNVFEYVRNNLNTIHRSATIQQFAPFSCFFEVMGDAMLPDFRPTDMLALKILPHPWKIENGQTYVIDTRGGVIVRMLYRIDGDNFLAKAFNPRFTELPIPSSDVYDIYMVVGLIRRNI